MVSDVGRRVAVAVKTATSENLQQIIIPLRVNFLSRVGWMVRREWPDPDRLLVRLWTSRSVRPGTTYKTRNREHDERFDTEFVTRADWGGFIDSSIGSCMVDDKNDNDMVATLAREWIYAYCAGFSQFIGV